MGRIAKSLLGSRKGAGSLDDELTLMLALKARYLFPVDRPPVAEGVLTIAGDRIAAVGENISGRPPVDLGNVAILPGLVNAHTHLEFSDLAAPIGQPRMPLADWIAAVVAHRRRRQSVSADIAEKRAAAVGQGLAESLRCGTTSLAEIATPGWPAKPVELSPIDTIVCLELIGLAAERAGPLIELARGHIAAAADAGWRAGLSPHAPYTVHPDLLHRAAQLSDETGVPLAMHLAESVEELDLLRSGAGPFVGLLEGLDAWHPSVIPHGTQPLDYLRILAKSHRALVVHGTYLDRTEIEFLASRNEWMSVVFCPRTHAYFGHGEYPLSQMLSAGVHVALGTDSRASNPDLSVLEEMRYLYGHYGAVCSDDILRLGTSNAARSLGLGNEIGVLAAGKRADLAVVELADTESPDPYESLLGGSGPVVQTYCAGRPCAGLSADGDNPGFSRA